MPYYIVRSQAQKDDNVPAGYFASVAIEKAIAVARKLAIARHQRMYVQVWNPLRRGTKRYFLKQPIA